MTEFQIVPPPTDGLADAFSSAAGRRRRTAATAGSASLLSAALVFAALTGSTGQVLTQEPAPPARQLPVIDIVPAPDDREPIELDAPEAGAPGQVTARGPVRDAAPLQQPAGPPNAAVAVPRTRTTAPQAGPSYRAAPMTRTSYDLQGGSLPFFNCSSIGGAELCSSVTASGSPATKLTVNLCNKGVAPTRLDFGSRDELDIEVRLEGKVLWRWAVGRSRDYDPHQVPVPVNGCLQWTTSWPAIDQGGTRLAKGKTYELVTRVDSPDAGDAAEATGYYYS